MDEGEVSMLVYEIAIRLVGYWIGELAGSMSSHHHEVLSHVVDCHILWLKGR